MNIETKFKVGDEVYYFNDNYFVIEFGKISKIEILYDGIETNIKYYLKELSYTVDEDECFKTLDECTNNIKLNLMTNRKHYSSRRKDHI